MGFQRPISKITRIRILPLIFCFEQSSEAYVSRSVLSDVLIGWMYLWISSKTNVLRLPRLPVLLLEFLFGYAIVYNELHVIVICQQLIDNATVTGCRPKTEDIMTRICTYMTVYSRCIQTTLLSQETDEFVAHTKYHTRYTPMFCHNLTHSGLHL